MLRLLTPSVLKAIHGGVGALGLAGMVYGVKKAIDAAADRKAKEMTGGALGAPGYQLVPPRFVLKGPVGRDYMSVPSVGPVNQSTALTQGPPPVSLPYFPPAMSQNLRFGIGPNTTFPIIRKIQT